MSIILSDNIYIFIAVALDETSIFVAVHFSKIYQSCDLGRGAEQRRHQPIMFFCLRDGGHG